MSGSESETLALPVPTPTASPSHDRISATFWRSLLHRPPRACKICRVGKRKCDKQHPVCGRCKRLDLSCSYDDLDIIQNVTSKGNYMPPPDNTGTNKHVTLALPVEIDPPGSYPIQERWYMPFLLQQFLQDFGMSKMPVDPKSIAYQMQTVYIRQSLTDPCMFHATMYAASAHLDAARNDYDNPITLYHQTQTLHLVQQRIAQSQDGTDEGLDGAIAGVIPLAFFTYLTGDMAESKNHLDGLVQMMAAKGGCGNLGLNGLLAGLITLSALVFTIVFDHPYLELSTLGWTEWPLRSPLRYISKLTSEVLGAFGEDRLPKLAHEMIHDIYEVTRSFNSTSYNRHHRAYITSILDKWHSEQESYKNGLDSPEFSALSTRLKERQTPIYRAVYLTGILFFLVIDDGDRTLDSALVQCKLLEELSVLLRDTKDTLWLEACPFLFSWLCLTGAAASDEPRQRAWFYYLQGPVFMALVRGPSCIQDVLSYYTWLRGHVTQI
ncbi:hypothetical protein BJX63DRAFT_410930 [Aspergillus granulosus]|uniref:Zn(2)-C6 fungal-type domain-containing protein n=1 Tax=Aspergillus granulosus TaxID=176169 RepID=A0ABR4GXN1_9EURO